MDLRPGTLIADRYRVERVLQTDERGTVFLTRTGRDAPSIAVKVLDPSASANHLITRFTRVQAIESPFLPTLLDLGGLPDGRTYVALEYLEGAPLKARLGHGPLAIPEAIEAMLQTCHAVAAAHDAGVVHRRLSTSKLFLARTASGGALVKVLGFVATSKSDDKSVPAEGINYLSPEQISGGVLSGTRSSDIWALGVIFYELLTGRLPFAALTDKSALKRILGDEPKRPRSIREELPWQLEQLLLRCLEKAPGSRIDSVRTMIGELEPFAAAPVREGSRSGIPTANSARSAEMPDVTKLNHLLAGGAESPEPSPAFHKLRTDGKLEGLRADDVAQIARPRRATDEAERLIQGPSGVRSAHRGRTESSRPPLRSSPPQTSGSPAVASTAAASSATGRIIIALIVAAVVLGMGSGLLLRLLTP